MKKCLHFGGQRCQKYAFYEKKLQIVRNRISLKKVREGMSISPTSEDRGSKDRYV